MAAAGEGINKQMDDQMSQAQQGQPEVKPEQPDPDPGEGKKFNKGGEVPGQGDTDTVGKVR